MRLGVEWIGVHIMPVCVRYLHSVSVSFSEAVKSTCRQLVVVVFCDVVVSRPISRVVRVFSSALLLTKHS